MARLPTRWRIVFLGLACVTAYACRAKPRVAEDPFLLRSLGLEYLEKGQLPEAEEQFKKIIAVAPREPFGYANLGVTYLRAGRFADAESQLRRAQRLDPSNPDVGLTLARLYALTDRVGEARAQLERLRRNGAGDARVFYALAELERQAADSGALGRRADRLRQALALAPANLAVRLQLVDVLARRGEADSVVRHLEELRRIPPEPPREAQPDLERSIRLSRAGRLAEARVPLERLLRRLEVTAPYQASLDEVKWVEGPLAGRPVLTYTPSFLAAVRTRRAAATSAVRFTDATSDGGLPEPGAAPATPGATETMPAGEPPAGTALAVGDLDGDGSDDLVASVRESPGRQALRTRLYHGVGGQFLDVSDRWGLPAGAAVHAALADVDNDGRLDLFLIGADGRGRLLRNEEGGRFADVTAKSGLADVAGGRWARFVDLDHDGDLDLLLAGRDRLLVFRNNLDGTFTEVAASMGLAGSGDATSAAFGDFDDDGRIDLFVTNRRGSDALYHHTGARRFADAAAPFGFTAAGGSGAVAVGDYDDDGLLDIFVASLDGTPSRLWHQSRDGRFAPDDRSAAALRGLRATAARAAAFVDYDNDGWLDLVVTGQPLTTGGSARGTWLFHNDGRGRLSDRSELLPASMRSEAGFAVAVSDLDGDGDVDLLVSGPGGARFLRNEDGNARLSMQVRLLALRTGSGKNNTFGIGAKVEVRAAEIYQSRVVTAPVTHFGLGSHLKADVVRVQWPNGVPQTVYFPGTDQDVLEFEQLKGSCGFLYTWDGQRFRFVTDVMWRSALGMPRGIMGGGGTAWAPAGASREYLRIPGDALRPRNGHYVLQFTEELWETAYLDEIRLLAVDHPESVDVFVDERFVPPGPVSLRLYPVVEARSPRTAVNQRGEDVLPGLRAQDDGYAAGLTPLRYQGLVEPHDLILDLGDAAGEPGSLLLLRGWIYPTDASINVALSQQTKLAVQPPSLEVRDANGRWTTAIANLGFPSGKDKTMVVELAGKFPTSDHHVRIRTNLQIYWDHVFVAREAATAPVRTTTWRPASADLHYRGFSRMYRKGGRYGPHWFDYAEVTKESPWRPIAGAFTRFGNVLPLLGSADDQYVIMGPGDEVTVQFDAGSANTVPAGWRRTFLLYTDGWIKDADLNTAFGNTVEPLPFHANRRYPYAPGESYPSDAAHRRYLEEYNTRVVPRR